MTTPYRFQVVGVRKITEFNGRVLLADEMGLGKTFQFLMYAKQNPTLRPIVVVCPASLKYNWQDEAAMHVGMRAEILETRKPPKGGLGFRPQLVIINYEILQYWLPWLMSLRPQLVGIDEAHYIKSRSSIRTKAVRALCHGVPHVIAISGTPLTNEPAELWPSLNILRPDLFKGFTSFGFRYCGPRKTPWGWQFRGATRTKELHKLLSESCMVRRLKKDVLQDLPPKTRVVLSMDMDRRHEYLEARDNFVAWILKNAPKKMKKALKAQALVKMGYLKRLVADLSLKYKAEWIDNFLEESGGKIVLFAVHKKVIRFLEERYKGKCVVVDGSVKGKHRRQAFYAFKHDKSIRVFIGNIRAAGVGWNATSASTVAFIELDWVPGNHIQAEDRIHRIGQKFRSFIYYLVAHDTIEEYLCKLLQKKQETLDAVLDDGKVDMKFDLLDQLIKITTGRK